MKPVRTALPTLVLLALPALGLAPRLAADETDSVKLYKQAVDSAVFIVTPVKGGMGMGSGSLIDSEKRYILTNYHVVMDADLVYCQFPVHLKDGSILTDKRKYIDRIPAGEALKGKVLYRDKTRDLALVQLDKLSPTAKQIKLAKQSASQGERTWNIGSPGAVTQVFSITSGEVRGVGNEDFPVGGHNEVFRIKCRMVTATNPTNQGDSGGPLINKNGEQVAVTESGDTSASLVNFFVDVMEVRSFLKEKKIVLKDDGPAESGPKPKVGLDSTHPKSEIAPKAPATGTTPPATGGTPAAGTTPGATAPAAPATGGASEADQKAAAQALSRAKIFAEGEDNRPTYIAKLKDVIAKYPDTDAAKEAKKLLAAATK